MRWKKSWFSYGVWAVYTLAVCIGFGSLLIDTAQQLGVTNKAGATAVAAGVCLFLVLLFGGIRRSISCDDIQENRKHGNEMLLKWSEPVILLILLAIGYALRVLCMAYAGEEGDYFLVARIIEGQSIPQETHGATYLYLQILHLLYWLVGNKWLAGIWLQVFLQLAACVLLYLAVRRLAGRAPATVMAAFMMLAPGKIAEGLTYSPKQLYLCCYAVALLCIAIFLQKRAEGTIQSGYSWILVCLTGVVTALVCYLDVSGFILLPLAASVLWLEKVPAKNIWGNSFAELGLYLVSVVVGFVGSLTIDAAVSGKAFGGVWSAWCTLYQPKVQNLSFWEPGEGENSTYMILFGLLFVGIFSFWCRKLSEKISPWVLMLLAVSIMECFQIPAEAMGSGSLLFLICTVLAGNGAADCFCHDMQHSPKEGQKEAQDIKPVMQEETKEASDSEHPSAEETMNTEENEVYQVELIDNPLPLPKKHVKKVMDYGYQPKQEEMEFDIQIAEDDDFDI